MGDLNRRRRRGLPRVPELHRVVVGACQEEAGRPNRRRRSSDSVRVCLLVAVERVLSFGQGQVPEFHHAVVAEGRAVRGVRLEGDRSHFGMVRLEYSEGVPGRDAL